ncbi:MAG: acetyltransferase [Methyloversatilis sp.]|uniref:acetyltransferase n=1 Tax=Methyloversatilis sp. TaxID=2569862 RepID=UPI0027375C24|nr:acetyltransferase [Methyloversatilis sp.]MDP3871346.1 acetyltransferase [Methyloversatilis sp.]
MTDRPLVILAAGGHGSVLLDALLSAGRLVRGIADPGLTVGSTVFDVPVLGDDTWVAEIEPSSVSLVNGAGVVPGALFRYRLYNDWKQRGFQFAQVVHPSAVIGRGAFLSEGSQVMAGATLQCRICIGENTLINTRVSVDHDCIIGSHVFVGPGATICGEVTLGAHVFIGAGAVVLPGVSIGEGAIVGAGTVVTRDVTAGALLKGVPATIRHDRHS